MIKKWGRIVLGSFLVFAMIVSQASLTSADTIDDCVTVSENHIGVMETPFGENEIDEVLSATPEDDELEFEAKKLTGVEGFVQRLYQICLDREPDTNGFNDWVGKLKAGTETGAHAAYGFIFSQEFQNKNLCNSDYVEYLYKAFMGRESDKAGKDNWLNAMKGGMTREEVFNGFALSQEFKNICNDYGIVVGKGIEKPQYGTVPKGTCSVCGEVDGVTAFVTRLYQVCLDRDPDTSGLKDWTGKLWAHSHSGADVSWGFIFSKEFTDKNLSNSDFVEYMYQAFFGRASDEDGKNHWINLMTYEGYERDEVFAGFVNSQEFMNLCNRYGITRGTITISKKLTPEKVSKMSSDARWRIISNGSGVSEYYGFWSKDLANSMMTQIQVPIWDFLNNHSTTKVAKTATITCNKNLAEYYKDAFTEIFNSPDQPPIRTSVYCYSYRQNVNNPSVLSTHSYGTAIDINASDNPNGKAMVTAAAWAQMPQGTISQYQKKYYTIYEGCTIYNILYKKYGLSWLGYNRRTVDAMHFEF